MLALILDNTTSLCLGMVLVHMTEAICDIVFESEPQQQTNGNTLGGHHN